MARYTGPRTKIARKFGEPIYGPTKVSKRGIILRGSTVHPSAGRLKTTETS